MSKAKPKATFEVQISDETWTCRLWKSKAYVKLHDDTSDAITTLDTKTMDFRDNALTTGNVAHELTHAHFKYLHLDSVDNPKMEDVEEIFASWLGSNYAKFKEKADAIYAALKGDPK